MLDLNFIYKKHHVENVITLAKYRHGSFVLHDKLPLQSFHRTFLGIIDLGSKYFERYFTKLFVFRAEII